MSLIYGVESTMPSNTLLTNGYSLFEWVMRKSCYPSFWGRSLTGEGTVTQEEIDFLKSKNCKIALIIRDLTEAEISGNDGTQTAMKAIEAAKAMGVPQNAGTALFAYIKPDWSVNHNWMMSFAANLVNNGYIPGFIGNTDSSKNFNFDRQCSHYVQATRNANQFNALYWSAEPKYDFDPEAWAPYAPSELLPNDMHLWSYGTIDFHDIHVNKIYAQSESAADHFYYPERSGDDRLTV